MTLSLPLIKPDRMLPSGRSFLWAQTISKWFVLFVACLSISASTFLPQREIVRMVPQALPAELSAASHLSPERMGLLLDMLRDPDHLARFGEAKMNTALGMPKLVRQQQHIRVWQYGFNNCVLDVYYTANTAKPAHVKLRTTETARSCLLQLALSA